MCSNGGFRSRARGPMSEEAECEAIGPRIPFSILEWRACIRQPDRNSGV